MIMRDLFGVLLRWWMVLEKKSNCSISKYRTGFLCVFPLSSSTSHIFMGNGSTSHIKMFCCSQWVSTLWTNGAKTSLFFRKKGLDALYFYLEQKKKHHHKQLLSRLARCNDPRISSFVSRYVSCCVCTCLISAKFNCIFLKGERADTGHTTTVTQHISDRQIPKQFFCKNQLRTRPFQGLFVQ